jgi:murein DD-endopeptidase MepM/ murein hydrolase activator NlpD
VFVASGWILVGPHHPPESQILKHGLIYAVETCLAFVRDLTERHPKRITAIVAALLIGGTGGTFAVANLAPDAADLPTRTVVESIPLQLSVINDPSAALPSIPLYRSEVTRSTETADSLLKRLGVFDAAASAFLRSNGQVQQVLLGRAGRNVTAEVDSQQALLSLTARWSPLDDGMFQRLSIQKTMGGFTAQLETLPLVASTRLSGGVIQTSLFAATDDARLPDAIAVQLAEIFSGDIDFHRALRKGDHFSVVYETLEGDGEPLRSGRVLSAEFVNAGKVHQAMWFREPIVSGAAAPKGGYYTLEGQSLRRAFLASPMEFSRVSSGFKMRFHPILQKWRAHLGVDYAAATGTPVRTVADGVVDFAGVQNGFGNVVIVKHRNNQTTVYAHLSRIGVKKGQSVNQGQNIGAVGATGWATGPHLHFEFRVNGVHHDPQTIARQSESTPVAASAKPLFNKAASEFRAQLGAAALVSVASAE